MPDLNDLKLFVFGEWEDEDSEVEDIQWQSQKQSTEHSPGS
jgi:hypothetical protein